MWRKGSPKLSLRWCSVNPRSERIRCTSKKDLGLKRLSPLGTRAVRPHHGGRHSPKAKDSSTSLRQLLVNPPGNILRSGYHSATGTWASATAGEPHFVILLTTEHNCV